MGENFSFGYWLRRQRLARDLRQADLAGQLGVAAITLRKIEADERRPSLQLVARLAELFTLGEEERATLLRVARADLSPAALALPEGAADVAVEEAPAETPAAALPSGTVTFLFTDIAGSTQLWERHKAAMRAAMAQHDAILRGAVARHGGAVVKGTGDGLLAAFALAEDALAAALNAQRALAAAVWGETGPLCVRMALHSGAAEPQGGDYLGSTLNRAARLLAAGHGGQVLLSLAAAELLRDQLPADVLLRDLGNHRLKDLTRPEQILQLVAPDLPDDFPPLRSLEVQRHNLPAQATALIGRERAVTELVAILRQPDVRLVTLLGPGGTGKTRLALQAAAEVVEQFPDGVWFVNLAPVTDPDMLLPAIAHVLDIRELGGRSLSMTLGNALRQQRLLLVLDNFEQIVVAAPQLAPLLAVAPGLRLLVTSREALQISGERRVAVPPLALPDLTALAAGAVAPGALSQYESVQLFIERARAARADFAVTNANAPAVAEICVRLDGLPLAIELAAARVRLFTPEALLNRIERRLTVLTGGPRDRPARQQTLRDAIAWSYTLLSAAEQALFRQLGVFAGGCTIAAAAAVCAGDELALLEQLAALADKSLLRQSAGPDGDPRFGMLETIREYALEQLEQAGELDAACEQHATYFVELAASSESQLRSARAPHWIAQLDAEYANLRAALQRLQAQGDAEGTVRLCFGVWRFWFDRGRWSEGRQGIAPVLHDDVLARLPAELQARALLVAGVFLARQSDFETARRMLERSRALFLQVRALGDEADVLFGLSIVAHGTSDYARAARYLREAEQLSRSAHDRFRIALYLGWLSYVTYVLGDLDRARLMIQESLAISRDLGINDQIGIALGDLGFQAYARGELSQAATSLEESVTLLRQSSNRYQLSTSLNYLAQVVAAQGGAARAVQLYGESLALRRSMGDRRGLVPVLTCMADASSRLGDSEGAKAQLAEAISLVRELDYYQGYSWVLQVAARITARADDLSLAVRLLGTDEALREKRQIPIWPNELPAYKHVRELARMALGDEAFAAAWAAGRAIAPHDALAVFSPSAL